MKAYWMPNTKNWGDVFTPFLFKNAFGVDVEWAPLEEARAFSCGSLLERIPDKYDGAILGSGMGYAETRKNLMKVEAPFLLRGPLSAARCVFNRPVRLGDPAVLTRLFAPNVNLSKQYRYGVIPHHADKDNEEFPIWAERHGALLIDIEAGVQQVIDAVCLCENILSSSLHGIIIADSLGIPSHPVKPSAKVSGNGFKFVDYYSTFGDVVVPSASLNEAWRLCRNRDVSSVFETVFTVFQEYVEKNAETSSDL